MFNFFRMGRIFVGMIGGGTVGGGVYQALCNNGGLITSRTGVEIILKQIAVKAFNEPRPVSIPESLMTTDWHNIINDPEIQIVVELMGGTGLAKEIILEALSRGKSVVTANKALLAAYGEEIFSAAEKNQVGLYYEASVAGGIPILRSIKEAFVCNRFLRICGIVNGTCNYILTQMNENQSDFETVLKEAQTKGYAEANASLDVDGHDAHHKITLLASLALNSWIKPDSIYIEGIRSVTLADLELSNKLGYSLKLLGSIENRGQDKSSAKIQASVSPTLIPLNHVLAKVNGVFNAVSVLGDVVGETFFYGRGAGQDATASAVVGDIVDAAINTSLKTPHRLPPMWLGAKVDLVAIKDITSRFYLRISGTSETAKDFQAILNKNNICVEQSKNLNSEGTIHFSVITQTLSRAKISLLLQEINKLSGLLNKPVAYPVEDFN